MPYYWHNTSLALDYFMGRLGRVVLSAPPFTNFDYHGDKLLHDRVQVQYGMPAHE